MACWLSTPAGECAELELVPDDWTSHVDLLKNLTYDALLHDQDDDPDGVWANDDLTDNALPNEGFEKPPENEEVTEALE